VVRAALFVFVLAGALLAAIVFTLNRNASRTNAQQAATELASGSRVAASAFAAMRSDLRAQAGELATSLDLQRAIVANDRAAIRRIAAAHHALIQARGDTTGKLLAAQDCESLGLVTAALDHIDWDDEVRIFLEERASFSADGLTGMEANLRFAGPETMESKIFGRLTAWQHWIFQRPNAAGAEGALKRYGSGVKANFNPERT